jgi:phage terminase large subunit-like protein
VNGGWWSLTEELSEEEQEALIPSLGLDEAWGTDAAWGNWAHRGQTAPEGNWSTWVLMGGRGFGKTRAGAEWVTSLVRDGPGDLRIALVGATVHEARSVMVEGTSGLLRVAGHLLDDWHPTRGLLRFKSGAEARLFSGASPESLRGPEHHVAWCDELAKWQKAQESWDMLRLGLRLGQKPRALVTTTPRPGPVLTGIIATPGTILTGGPTKSNPHNAEAFTEHVYARYAGTRLALQELDGQLLTDAPGALWTVELLERCRASLPPHPKDGEGDQAMPGGGVAAETSAVPHENHVIHGTHPSTTFGGAPPHLAMGRQGAPFLRLVIAVDPPSGDGTCGIVACARDMEGRAHVLADHSVTATSPEGWSGTVASAAAMWGALHPRLPRGVEVVAESNQGGAMIGSVIRTADKRLKVKLVPAIAGKAERAAPVAMLFEAGKVTLHGRFPELEAQLMGLIAGGDYKGPGESPDRADAMVWALTELMLLPEQAEPRVRAL